MTELTPSERLVLGRLAHYDGPGGAWPSHERIGAEVGLKRRQVINILASIRRKGRVRWRRRHGFGRSTNLYEIAYAEPFQCANLERSNVQPDCTRTGREGTLDLCEGEPCDHGAFVEPGALCLRCGWRRRE